MKGIYDMRQTSDQQQGHSPELQFTTLDKVLLATGAVGLAAILLLPDTGAFALWDVLGNSLFFTAAGIECLRLGVLQGWKKDRWPMRLLTLGFTVLLLFMGITCGINLARDAVEGSQVVFLEDCSVSERHSRESFDLNYYLTGYDSEGECYRIEISAEDYDRLQGDYFKLREGVRVRGFIHTERAVKVF
jgi:uncharacterized protein YxeA